MWTYVENNTVIEEHTKLPANWRNHSNFFAFESDLELLKELGWYRLVDQTVPISDDFLEYHNAPVYDIHHDQGVVYMHRPLVQYQNPTSPEQRFVDARKSFLDNLRQERKIRLQETDWTQTLDMQIVKGEEWRQSWAQHRQALRDLPQLYEQDQYKDMIDLNAVDWPQVPEND
jgi:2-succinyl-5-enolpyruvyl-6-hydroxy-3-cyclohexene-1-carboxylate synthase